MTNLITFAQILEPSALKMGMNIAFFVILGIVILGGIFGMIRGIFNSSFRLVFMGLLVVLCFVFTSNIAHAIAKTDLSSLFGTMEFTLNEEIIQITTVEQTVNAMIASFVKGNNAINLLDPNTIAFIQELSMMVVRFATFIILALLVATLGNLLCTALYHLLFKLFIPKKTRKKYKLRIVSFFVGLINSLVVTCLVIIPFTSVLNTLNQTLKKGNNAAIIDNELYNEIIGWVNAYDDSLLAQVLFNWTADENGKTFDVTLINLATKEDDNSLLFMDELGALTSIGNTIFGSGGLLGDNKVDLTLLLSDAVISSIIASMAQSKLVDQLLPLVLAYALNLEDVEKYLDTSKIDLDGIVWNEELSALQEIISGLNQTGLVNYNDIANGKNTDTMLRSIFADGNKDSVTTVLKKLDSSKLVSKLLPAVLYHLANEEPAENAGESVSISDILPKEWSAYENLKVGNELSILYSSMFDMNKAVDGAILDCIVPVENNIIDQPEGLIKFASIIKNENITEPVYAGNALIDVIMKNADKVLPYVAGVFDEDGLPIVDDKGLSLPNNEICLLDSELMINSMDGILKTVISAFTDSVQGLVIDETRIDALLTEFAGRSAYKVEFNSLLSVASAIITDSNLSGLQEGNLDLTDDNVIASLKGVLPKLDGSKIMTEIVPDLIESNVSTMNDELATYGLATSDFDFHVANFGAEMVGLLDAYQSINRLSTSFDQENLSDILKDLDSNDIKVVLDKFYESKILNPSSNGKNVNFYKVIDAIFNFKGLEVKGITSKISGLNDVAWLDNGATRGENYYISQFFAGLTDDSIITLLNGEESDIYNPSVFQPQSLADLFASVGKSKVVSAGFGEVLDRVFLDTINISNMDISFTSVYDWETEGTNLANVISGIQKINKTFNEINWIDENPEYLNDILCSFSQSQLFVNSSTLENKFDGFMLSVMKTAMPDYLKDYGSGDTEETRTFVTATEDFAAVINWNDEIDAITNAIDSLQKAAPVGSTAKGDDGLKALQDGTASATIMEEVMLSINDAHSLRMVFVNALDSTLSGNAMNIGSLNLSDANVGILMTMDKYERATEISHVIDAYDHIYSMNLANGFEIASVEGEEVKMLLDSIYQSRVLNTLKNEMQSLTVFEQVIKLVIEETGFEDKILQNGETLVSKIRAIGNDYAGTMSANTNGWTIEDGETTKIGEIISAFKDTGVKSFELSEDDFSDLIATDESIDKLSYLFKAINNSVLFYRGLPVVMDECLNGGALTVEALSINTALINTDYNNGAQYEDSEIDKLTEVMKAFADFNEIKDSEGNDIDDPTLSDLDLAKLDVLLVKLHGSKMFNTMKGSSREQTFFENVIVSIVRELGLDTKAVNNNKTLNDIIFEIGNSVAVSGDVDGWVGINKEISHIIDIMGAFKDISIDDGDITKKDKWTEDEVYNTLYAINTSKVCYRAIPSLLDDLIDSTSVDGINLLAANTHYNDDLAYDDGEIDTIAKIYSSLDTLKDSLDDINDLSKFTDEKIDTLKALLINISSSQVFHLSGSDEENVDTIFEQVMLKTINDSGLAKLSHDATIFVEDTLVNASDKARNNILSYSTLVNSNSQYTWKTEIDSLFDIVNVIRDDANLSNPENIDIAAFTPNIVNKIFTSLINSELVYDAVPSQMKQIFTSIGLSSFANNHEDYLLTTSLKTYRDEYKDSEINTLTKLLESAQIDEDYIKFGGDEFSIESIVENGFSMKAIVEYFAKSRIFFECRGLTLKNAIATANFSGYIRNTYDSGIKNVFDEIFTIIDEDEDQIEFEGLALDELILRIDDYEEIEFKNLNTEMIKSLYKTVYNEETVAMLGGEILFGFLDDSIMKSGFVQDGFVFEWFKDQLGRDFVYPMANDAEANGLSGAISLVNVATMDFTSISNITGGAKVLIEDAFALLETNNTKSIIAMATYQKGFYDLFKTSLRPIYDNADFYFFGKDSEKTKMTTNYDALLKNAFADEFVFANENVKIQNILDAVAA